ncbi:sulfite exporter TauE/SafE family protein [Anatilimnocola sp. NA78]|uniref:sulfite exporter TauE/SafE family protein n=1 Tax=Anatilimnocola sp. NA78 TaxID=3415683 RepID=UPI003CE4C26F
MIELPLVFVAGVLGTAHCLGMCGPLAIGISTGAKSWSVAFIRQLLYSAGRLLSYSFLGLMAGFSGEWIARHTSSLINVPAVFAIIAGVVFIVKGLQETGLATKLQQLLQRLFGMKQSTASNFHHSGSCGLLFAPFFRGQGHTGALIAGVCTGFLPCGLLYGMLTLAASTHQVLLGGATMLVFGLGTMPLLVLAGTTGQLLSLGSRRWLFGFAAWCLVLTGVVSLARGLSYVSWGARPAAGCPLCTAESNSTK